MRMTTVLAAAVAAVFAMPLQADDKKASGAGASRSDGGAEAMFKALDKNTDGFVTKEEAKGTPHDKDFSMLDKDGDGKLSPEEHAAAPEHAGKASGAGGTAGSKEPKK